MPGSPIPIPRIAYPGDPESLIGQDLGPYPIDADPTVAELLRVDRWVDLTAGYVASAFPSFWPF